MLLPYRDAPNPEGRPLVTWLLIAANVLVFVAVTLPLAGAQLDLADPVVRRAIAAHPELLASLARGGSVGPYDLFLFDWGFIPAEASVRTLFASMFLHGGFMHLFGNMLFLWIYGDNVEARLGRVGYLAAYLGTGVAATATQAVFDLSSTTPMVGASGAISGVLGLYFVFFPRNVVHVFVALFPFFLQTIQVPARLALGFYLVFQNLLPVFFGAGGSVAHGAHIGGFVGGLGLAYLVGARGAERA
ncbi:MAG: rhomboid family intramembrane serine protease, partial [Planctomycetota bacterium]